MKGHPDFAARVDRFDRRIDDLRDVCRGERLPSRELLGQLIDELSTSLEELRAAEDEIEQQNRDLTLAQAETELERRRYRELFWTAPHGYILTDQTGAIQEANRAAAELFGDDASRLVGKPIPLLVSPPDRPRFRAWMQELGVGRHPADAVEFLMHSVVSDRIFPCRVECSPTGTQRGAPLLWSLVDLTDQKRARERDWFEEEAARKDEFLAMLGHELRNPLAAISLAAQLIEGELPDENDPVLGRSAWSARIIGRHSAHLTRLVDDLLDVSRVYHGKVALKCTDVDLGEVVAGAVETVQPVIRQKGHLLEVHAAGRPLRVLGDPVRLQQVMANLLDNAAKYTPAGGRIEVRMREVGPSAVVSVRDFGVGIPQDRIDRIFDLFEQGGPPSAGGLGLGLTLARELVKMHGGTIDARSEGLDHGTEFLVTLPLEGSAREEEPAAPPPARTAGASVRVLVVDDNRDAAEMLGMSLEQLGHQVVVVFSAESALQQSGNASVALIDLGMPEMDGFELARRLRSVTPDMQLVAVTGFGDERNREAAGRAGFDRYILKPVSLPELDAILRGS